MLANGMASLLQEHRDQLTANERRLVEVLAADPLAATFLSGRELAQRAGVHESSAVRLAQKFGFDGYPAFRKALREPQHGESSLRVSRTLAAADDGDLFNMLLGREVESLLAARQHVRQEQIDAAARTLSQAQQVFVWAGGNAKVLADLLDRRLRSLGLRCTNIAHEGRELAERLVALGKGDVVVAFLFRRPSPGLGAVLNHAARVKARSLLIADMSGHTLTPQPDQLIAAPRGDDEKFLTLSVPMLIANALVLSIAQRDAGRSMAGMQTLDALRRDLGLSE